MPDFSSYLSTLQFTYFQPFFCHCAIQHSLVQEGPRETLSLIHWKFKKKPTAIWTEMLWGQHMQINKVAISQPKSLTEVIIYWGYTSVRDERVLEKLPAPMPFLNALGNKPSGGMSRVDGHLWSVTSSSNPHLSDEWVAAVLSAHGCPSKCLAAVGFWKLPEKATFSYSSLHKTTENQWIMWKKFLNPLDGSRCLFN